MLYSGTYLVLCSAAGYLGGIWLWRELASNPIFQQIKKVIKFVAFLTILALAALFFYLGWSFLHADAEKQKEAIQHVVPFLWFCLGYLVGYDIILIILFVPWELIEHRKPYNRLRLNKPLIIMNLALILAGLYPALVLYSHPFLILTGLCLGILIWYHLHQLCSLSKRFLRMLAIFSFVTTGYLYFTIMMILLIQFNGGVSGSISLQFIYSLLQGFLASLIFYFVALLQISFKKGTPQDTPS